MSVKTHSTMKKQYNNKIPGCFHPGQTEDKVGVGFVKIQHPSFVSYIF